MKSIPELLAEYETRLLKDRLLEYPSMILSQKAVIRDARGTYNEAAQEAAILEADISTDIAAEMDPASGKAKYSNDKTRQAELMKRKAADPVCVEATKRLRETERSLGMAQDALEALQDKFKAYRYIVRLTAEELALMASEEQEEVEHALSGQGFPGAKATAQPY